MKSPTRNISRLCALLLLTVPVIAGCGAHKEAAGPGSQSAAAKPPPPSVAHNIAVLQGKGR